jgi:hypothetical protein
MADMKTRTPPEYTKEQIDLAIEMAIGGETIGRIVDALCTTRKVFWTYRQHNPSFENTFAQARQEGLDYIAEGMRDHAKDVPDVQRARLMVDTDKWLLSKLKPALYGDKIDIHVSQTIDIRSALTEARKRALPPAESNVVDLALDVTPTKINVE